MSNIAIGQKKKDKRMVEAGDNPTASLAKGACSISYLGCNKMLPRL